MQSEIAKDAKEREFQRGRSVLDHADSNSTAEYADHAENGGRGIPFRCSLFPCLQRVPRL